MDIMSLLANIYWLKNLQYFNKGKKVFQNT